MHALLKDSIFEVVSPTRHTSKLGMLMKKNFPNSVALFIYADGGPDHNYKYIISVRLGLLSLIMEFVLGIMVVVRMAPIPGWRNPIKRVMFGLNFWIARSRACQIRVASQHFDKESKKYNEMGDVREAADAHKKKVAEPPSVAKLDVEGIDALRNEQRQNKNELLTTRQHHRKEKEKMLLLTRRDHDLWGTSGLGTPI
jgi:hypothetical protein